MDDQQDPRPMLTIPDILTGAGMAILHGIAAAAQIPPATIEHARPQLEAYARRTFGGDQA